jgi:hypothetical protein
MCVISIGTAAGKFHLTSDPPFFFWVFLLAYSKAKLKKKGAIKNLLVLDHAESEMYQTNCYLHRHYYRLYLNLF